MSCISGRWRSAPNSARKKRLPVLPVPPNALGRALTLLDFYDYFEQAGIQTVAKFGSYELDPFNENNSNRLILIFK